MQVHLPGRLNPLGAVFSISGAATIRYKVVKSAVPGATMIYCCNRNYAITLGKTEVRTTFTTRAVEESERARHATGNAVTISIRRTLCNAKMIFRTAQLAVFRLPTITPGLTIN